MVANVQVIYSNNYTQEEWNVKLGIKFSNEEKKLFIFVEKLKDIRVILKRKNKIVQSQKKSDST